MQIQTDTIYDRIENVLGILSDLSDLLGDPTQEGEARGETAPSSPLCGGMPPTERHGKGMTCGPLRKRRFLP
jgi:hypothetical protein